MDGDLKDVLLSALRAAPVATEYGPWTPVIHTAVGGARAIGFARGSETLLVASANGQSVYDCTTGAQLHRDRAADGYDPDTLSARRLDDPAAAPLPMAGLDGGGLRSATPDGWSVEALPLDWPRTWCILQPPGASIHFLHPKWRGFGKDASFALMGACPSAPVAFGFSWSGRSLALCDGADLRAWRRP